MRQIPIEKFKRNIKAEIKDIPFEVTRRGSVLFIVNHAVELHKKSKTPLNHVVEQPKVEKSSLNHAIQDNSINIAKNQLVDIVEKKVKIPIPKVTIDMDAVPWTNPLAGGALAPKK